MSKLPPITAALADAITEAQEEADFARRCVSTLGQAPIPGGLAPVGVRSHLEGWGKWGADLTDLHITLTGGPMARALYLALLQAGADCPHTVMHADVILSSGEVAIYCERPTQRGLWRASLGSVVSLGPPRAQHWTWG